MSTIKVVDVNNEEGKEAPPEVEAIEEETKEEVKEELPEPINEVVEQPKEETKEEAKPKRQTQKDKITCAKCGKEMTIKSYRYSHEKNCQGQLSERKVKPQSKPKQKAKPIPQTIYEESSEEEEQQPQQKPIKKKQPVQQQPQNPLIDITNHYQSLPFAPTTI